MKRRVAFKYKNTRSKHRQIITLICILIVSGFNLRSQNLFEIQEYELPVKHIRTNATPWDLSPQKVRTVLNLDVESYFGSSSSTERIENQKEQLYELRDKCLKQFFYIDQKPKAHIYDESDLYSHEEHGITIQHKGLCFSRIPRKTVDIVPGILTTQVQSLVNTIPKFEAFETNRENHRVILLFKLVEENAQSQQSTGELNIKNVRVVIYNKFSNEVVYDHFYGSL